MGSITMIVLLSVIAYVIIRERSEADRVERELTRKLAAEREQRQRDAAVRQLKSLSRPAAPSPLPPPAPRPARWVYVAETRRVKAGGNKANPGRVFVPGRFKEPVVVEVTRNGCFAIDRIGRRVALSKANRR